MTFSQVTVWDGTCTFTGFPNNGKPAKTPGCFEHSAVLSAAFKFHGMLGSRTCLRSKLSPTSARRAYRDKHLNASPVFEHASERRERERERERERAQRKGKEEGREGERARMKG